MYRIFVTNAYCQQKRQLPILKKTKEKTVATLPITEEILNDYFICCLSRSYSLSIRKAVLSGRAKFGVSDDGKELFQVAMAKSFQPGDFRADYYRGHTLLLALGIATVDQLYAQLYADSDNDPFSAGRQMNNHHATPLVDADGQWLPHYDRYNLSSDISTTGGQMARGYGLAFASKVYREATQLQDQDFSRGGNEICYCNIGDASTSEGAFWETVNAAGVTQIPLIISVLDDGYGISVPKKQQTTKESISTVLEGFQENEDGEGLDIYLVKAWDYPALCELYINVSEKVRHTHTPALIHLDEMTQPQGHSTSGSHERYKSGERLAWEKEHDCNVQFRKWILANNYASESELKALEKRAENEVKEAQKRAWNTYYNPINVVWQEMISSYTSIIPQCKQPERVNELLMELKALVNPVRVDLIRNLRRLLYTLRKENLPEVEKYRAFLGDVEETMDRRYHTHLYSESSKSALKVPVIPAVYSADAKVLRGYEILNSFFDKALANYSNLYAFGEDVGQIGGVNQGFAGLQKKYGAHRVFDTGIREWTIIGMAIGMSMRGLRPIAEIQYLDYLIYAFSPLSDDLATIRYRTNATQIAPAIIRTRGHRLEGIWHSGSPMAMLLGGLRGMYVLVPRNMVQAAGMYNTLLQSDDPALLIECLNAYRQKEKLPENLDQFTVPLGVPEVLLEGEDLTIVTYGACVRIAQEAVELLAQDGISVELIDVQTLLPFDLEHRIVASLQKTNRVIFLDEDVPGGASAYMLQEVLEKQDGYRYLDSKPLTISAQDHRPPYGSDGDYFSKPNAEDVYQAAFDLIFEAEPGRF
ncbi:MAG: transketolase [Saprospiraceae bacterium]|nr:MAG: transketolase [Saprospiraceae bacterium]